MQRSLQNPMDLECLRDFDHQRFGVLARALQVLLAHGALDYAIAAVRQFAAQTRRVPATRATQLIDVVGVRIANALEDIGCTTVGAFVRMCDGQILAVPNLGDGVVAIRDRLILELQRGELVEDLCAGGAEGLEFDFLDAEVPRELVQFSEGVMSTGVSSNVSVFDALRVLSERREEAAREIEAKIIALEDEISSLKQMQKLLGGKTKKQRKLPGDLVKVAASMAEVLVGKALKPGEIAGMIGSTPIQIGKIAANDERFKRNSDGRIALA